MNIQWYPGHMTKTRRRMTDALKLVDAVIELLDARIPQSSRNPDIDELCGDKPRLVVLNRGGQADARVTAVWKKQLISAAGGHIAVCEADCKSKSELKEVPNAIYALMSDKLARYAAKGQAGRGLRLMVVGVPNVGKSTFINALAGRKAAKAEDRPGVTRGNQWFSVGDKLEMLDTPGILWPKFEDERTGLYLAFTGAIRDQVLDTETLAARLCETLLPIYPQSLAERYKIIQFDAEDGFGILEAIGRRRGFLVSGGEVDIERASIMVLDEFRAGLLGRITLDRPESTP